MGCLCVSVYHQMETFSALLSLYAGNSPVTGEFPPQRLVMRNFDVFFDLHPNRRLSKHSSRRWFETPLRSLWRHCNAMCTWIFCSCLWYVTYFTFIPTSQTHWDMWTRARAVKLFHNFTARARVHTRRIRFGAGCKWSIKIWCTAWVAKWLFSLSKIGRISSFWIFRLSKCCIQCIAHTLHP